MPNDDKKEDHNTGVSDDIKNENLIKNFNKSTLLKI